MTELKQRAYLGVGADTHFYMTEIEVDGQYTRNRSLYDGLMFSLKEEEDALGRPTDTGRRWYWYSDIEISEKHWLKCGTVIPKHSTCELCGERDLDE